MSAVDDHSFSNHLMEIYRQAKLPACIVDDNFEILIQSGQQQPDIPSLDQQVADLKATHHIQLIKNEIAKNGLFQTENAAGLFAGYELTICSANETPPRYLIQPAFVSDQGTALKPAGISQVLTAFDAQYRKPINILFSSISGLGQTLSRQNGTSRSLQYLQMMNQQTYQLLRAFEWTMIYTRLANGLVPVRLQRIEFVTFIRDLLTTAQELTESLNIALYCDLPQQPLILLCDTQLFSYSMVNILSNACRYTNPGTEIIVKVKVQQSMLHISVSDFGIGIPEDILARVFEPYYSYSADGMPFSGMGLGLAIAKLSISLLGGGIALTSQSGEGTTVSITLPIKDNLAVPEVFQSPSLEYASNRLSLLHIALSDSVCMPYEPV